MSVAGASHVELGDVIEIVMGQAPPGDACNKEGIGKVFVKAGEFQGRFPVVREWTTKPLKHAKPGDTLVCVVGATAGKVNLSNLECAIGRSVAAVRAVPEKLDPLYLFHFLQTRVDLLRAGAQGAAQGVITREMLAGLRLYNPPLAEQRRIAAILDHADTLRAKRWEALAQLDSLTQSIFIEMFGDPASNPMHWPMRAFGQICETRLGKMLDQKQQTGEHLRPYLRNANVQWHRFDLSDVFEMDFDESARSIFRLHPGDLLICEGGEPGRAAIWNGEISECYYQKALHRARPNRSAAIAAYLAWLLWFLSKGGGLGDHVTAATIAHLTGEKLKAMSVMVPPLVLQQTFATRIQAVESLKTIHRAALAESDSLFASLQHRAFSGSL